MAKLNLIANNDTEKRILEYLEENASDTLVDKINNGVRVTVDGKELLNIKALDGFLQYAEDEARTLAEKNARSVCVADDIVFGWAIHYFEEDSIHGKLFNSDGTEYKKPVPKPVQTVVPKAVPVKKETERQYSIFDLASDEETDDVPQETATEQEDTDDENEETDGAQAPETDEEQPFEADEEDDETELTEATKQVQQVVKDYAKASPMFQKYLEVCRRFMGYIVAYRLGDFYEMFDNDAVKACDVLGLTLTSKNVGLPERIPMCGVPYHAIDMYAKKLSAKYNVVIYDNEKEFYIYEQGRKTNGETGEITELSTKNSTQVHEIDAFVQHLKETIPYLKVTL